MMIRNEFSDYDAGLINDHGGGDVGWWQDYIRSEIQSANEHWRAQIEQRADSAVPEGFRIFRSPHEGDTDIHLAMKLGDEGYLMSSWLSEGGRDDDDTVGRLAYRLADALLSAQPAQKSRQDAPEPAVESQESPKLRYAPPDVARLVEALEKIAQSCDSGRHDGLPEDGPALDDVEAWIVANEALAAHRKGGDQ